jgi:biopolymer transport protein ExbD
MKFRRPGRRRPRIELIPMIDTIFFILVFFVVASISMVHQRGLRVELPAAATGARPEGERVEVTVEADGSVYVNEDRVAWMELTARLRRVVGAEPDVLVVVNADRKAEHGRVVDVMDSARQAGAHALTIATQPGTREQ